MLFPQKEGDTEDPFADVEAALVAVRDHLGMDVSYLSEFQDDSIVIRAISTADGKEVVPAGHQMGADLTYCAHVRDGRLPHLIQDTEKFPLANDLAITHEVQIKSHISVPIHRTDGSVYGMFCCFGHEPNRTLNDRDLGIVTMFADLAARRLNSHLDAVDEQIALRDQIAAVIDRDLIKTHFQPIISLRRGAVMAVEALSRFQTSHDQSVLWWFEQARAAEMQESLELAAMSYALDQMPDLPPETYMTVNVSPATFASDGLMKVLTTVPPNRVVVELTEHTQIAATECLRQRLREMRARGIGIAIDDVGAGYAGLNALVELRPDVIKLDRSLVHGIHDDQAKQSLTRAMLDFSGAIDAFLIAEGVEDRRDHHTLTGLGARLGQGFLYGRPEPAHQVSKLLSSSDPVQADPSLFSRAALSRAKSSPAWYDDRVNGEAETIKNPLL